MRKYSNQEPKKQRQPAEVGSEFDDFLGLATPKLSLKAGMNRFTWDLRYKAPVNVPGFAQWGGSPRGPLAIPGTYTTRLTVTSKHYAVPFEVRPDPRVKATAADFAKQFELAADIVRRITEANVAVNQMLDLRAQLTDLKDRYVERNPGDGLSGFLSDGGATLLSSHVCLLSGEVVRGALLFQ